MRHIKQNRDLVKAGGYQACDTDEASIGKLMCK